MYNEMSSFKYCLKIAGEEAKSFGYGGTGKAATDCKFEDYGQQFTAGDVITAYLVGVDSI